MSDDEDILRGPSAAETDRLVWGEPRPMTDIDAVISAIRETTAKATPGEWHHVNAFQSVPKARTVHGTVPAQRIDYVSTWPHLGTPGGHRVVVAMERDNATARSEDMAHIAACSPANMTALLAHIDALRAERDEARKEARNKVTLLEVAKAGAHLRAKAARLTEALVACRRGLYLDEPADVNEIADQIDAALRDEEKT